ncbi:hypothetical protein [uncultured Deefgea sp.]|uniref:hypothetical protein n=1 Tax=uncultured Deefgea sp. TaxID=1304914 RepID=UPI002607CD60|nr:hypothetical protein [uncultured Deefgea sp.]
MYGATTEQIESALVDGKAAILAYAKQRGFDDIHHAKGKNVRGVGLHTGVASIRPTDSPVELLDKADLIMGRSKGKHEQGDKNVGRGTIQTAGNEAPAGATERGETGGVRETDSAIGDKELGEAASSGTIESADQQSEVGTDLSTPTTPAQNLSRYD